MERLYLKPEAMDIPSHILLGWQSHMKRVAGHAACDPSDTRTANALRLLRRDLRTMERYLHGTKKDKKK